MGREVVYCHRCQTRLRGQDFDAGAAYRVGEKITCAACLDEIAQELPLAERLALLSKVKEFDAKPPSSGQFEAVPPGPKAASKTRSISTIPKGAPPPTPRLGVRPGSTVRLERPAGRPRLGMILGIAGGALALLAVILVVSLGGRKAPPETVEAEPAPKVVSGPKPAGPSAPDPAKNVIERTRRLCKENPQDLAGHVKTWEKVLWDVAGSPLLAEAKAELEAAKARLQQALLPELAAVEEKWRAYMGREEFKAAQHLLEKDRNRYEAPGWTLAIDKRIRETRDAAGSLFETVKQQAEDARLRGSADEMSSIRDRVAKWGLESFVAEIDRIFEGAAIGPAPAPVPVPEKPLTKEGQAYRERWTQASILALARKYEDALAELERASRPLEEADVKAEAAKDVDLLRQAAAACAAALKALAEWPRLSVLSLAYYDESGNRQALSEPVHKTDAWHVEFRKEKKLLFVDFQDVTGDSLAEVLNQKGKNPSDNDRRAAALLCLLDGDKDAAAAHLGGRAERIPAKYWAFATEARSKAPKPDSRELEARRLFYAAEQEYRSPETRGGAIEKYKCLRDTCAVTEVVRRYQETILKRAESGKECVLAASDLRGRGFFKMTHHSNGVTAWTSQADVPDPKQAPTNYVDIDFFALPQTVYRCWVYLGACCQETFACYLQATEMTGPNPRKSFEKVPYEPGKVYAAVIKHRIANLKETHAQHGGPKQPSRWEWVEIPLPRYSGGGHKKVRILGEQQGFSAAYAVVSSLRKSGPDEAETKELAKVPVALGPERGGPDPLEWFLAGPFEKSMGAAQPPEGKIDLEAPMRGARGEVKWKLHQAELRENRLAVLDFDPLFSPNEHVSAYALIHVHAPQAMDCKLLVGSDDGVKVWLNGQVVHTNDSDRALKIDEDTVSIRLNAGWNRLLFKVRDAAQNWALSMRFVDGDRRPLQGLLYDAAGDLAGDDF